MASETMPLETKPGKKFLMMTGVKIINKTVKNRDKTMVKLTIEEAASQVFFLVVR